MLAAVEPNVDSRPLLSKCAYLMLSMPYFMAITLQVRTSCMKKIILVEGVESLHVLRLRLMGESLQ